jgi:putative toxin-antitoxin system antitoxin component (TIGR02293 family)
MNTNEEARNENARSQLRGRSKEPGVYTPAWLLVKKSECDTSSKTPAAYFLQIVVGPDNTANCDLGSLIKRGAPSASLVRFKETLGIGKEQVLTYLDMSSATYARRTRGRGKLSTEETDRIFRYARLVALATNLFNGDEDEAMRWLKSPAYAFKGETPLEHATTEFGAHEVETLIGRLEHGIPT